MTSTTLSRIKKVIDSKLQYTAIILIYSKQFLEKSNGNDDYYDIENTEEETDENSKISLFTSHFLRKRITFFDELDFGGTTYISQEMMINYKLDIQHCHNIFMTATYSKPTKAYNLPKKTLFCGI